MCMCRLKQENQSLYALKCVAAFGVVFIHCKFPGEVGKVVAAMARIAVPIFFMISGYYVCLEDVRQIHRNIIKIFKIIIFMELLYTATTLNSLSFIQLFNRYFCKRSLMNLILFQNYGSCGAGWFLYALLFCYVSVIVMRKWKHRIILGIMIGSIGVHLVCQYELLRTTASDIYTSNFWLMGLPFFWGGITVNRYKHKILKFREEKFGLCLCVGGGGL